MGMYATIKLKLIAYDPDFFKGKFISFLVKQFQDWGDRRNTEEIIETYMLRMHQDPNQLLKITFDDNGEGLKGAGVEVLFPYFESDFSNSEPGKFEFQMYYDFEYEPGCYLKFGINNTKEFHYSWAFGYNSSPDYAPFYMLNTKIKTKDNKRIKELLFDPNHPQIKPKLCLSVSDEELVEYIDHPVEILYPKIKSREISYWLKCDAYSGRDDDDYYYDEDYDDENGNEGSPTSRENELSQYWNKNLNISPLFNLDQSFFGSIYRKFAEIHVKDPCFVDCKHQAILNSKLAFYSALEAEEPFIFIMSVIAAEPLAHNIMLDEDLQFFDQREIRYGRLKNTNSPSRVYS